MMLKLTPHMNNEQKFPKVLATFTAPTLLTQSSEPKSETKSEKLPHNGHLSLTFANSGGKTIVTNSYQRPPLRSSRAMYLHRPNIPSVYMVETSGGLLSGDSNTFDINVNEGAQACLIPQSATKIYPSFDGHLSSTNVNINIAPQAYLSWKIEPIIPFAQSKFHSKVVVNMRSNSSFLWGDIISPGRVKYGECFAYSFLKTSFEIWVDDSCMVYDQLLFSPLNSALNVIGLLEDYLYVGSIYLIFPDISKLDIRELNERLNFDDMKVGATMLDKKALNIRWLGKDLVELKKQMNNIWHEFDGLVNEI